MRLATYSPSFTVVPTHECFNRCAYCNFRADRGAPWLVPEAARAQLAPLVDRGVSEVLILSGEVHPADPRRGAWLAMIEGICEAALDLGLLPHTNCGVLTRPEMERLARVNCSMGLMLEIARDDLAVHRHAPSKRTAVRLEQLVWAGELGIPFTTGLLLGIGEQEHDRLTTLALIAEVHGRFGHIQEVILQPHSPGAAQPWPGVPFAEADLLALVAQARAILPPQVTIQIPPNLVDDPVPFLEAGARDLGGIGPVDVVNPDYDHPEVARLAGRLSASGWRLVPRLPVYPQFEDNLPARLRPLVARWRAKLLQVE